MITQRQLRNESGAIMRALDAGETLLVTRNGEPVAELVPFRRRRAIGAAELVAAARRQGSLDATRFRLDVDRAVDQSP